MSVNKEQIKVIFFDAVGTLFGVKGSVGQMYKIVADQFGVEIDPITTDRCFYKAFKLAPPMAFPDCMPAIIPQREYDWWKELAVQTFKNSGDYDKFTDFDRFFSELYNFFASAQPWEVYPDVIESLNKFQSLGYKLGIISNFDSRIFNVLKSLGLDKFFAGVIISSQTGASKPDRLIYTRALEEFQVKPQEALHVGDSQLEDYEGAIGAGLSAFWLQRPQQTLAEVLFCIKNHNIESESFRKSNKL